MLGRTAAIGAQHVRFNVMRLVDADSLVGIGFVAKDLSTTTPWHKNMHERWHNLSFRFVRHAGTSIKGARPRQYGMARTALSEACFLIPCPMHAVNCGTPPSPRSYGNSGVKR